MIATVLDHPLFGACICLDATDGSQATVALHGGHVVSWKSSYGTDRLFMSSLASTRGAIRGGIPVCFPQFASVGELPKHGYARTSLWRHGGGGRFVLDVPPTLWTGFAFPCVLLLDVSLGPSTLGVAFTVENIGPSAFTFTGALHTYLAVEDVRSVRVDGLNGLDGRDTEDNGDLGDPATSNNGISFGAEVDRNFEGISRPAVVVVDGEPTMLCAQTGFLDAVVWNSGPLAAESIADLGKDEWARYVCVEAAVLTPVRIEPGTRWTGTQTLVDLTG
jgi:glucose-6-phosphate 1-epimerase